MTLKTFANVRTLMRHLLAEHRERPIWRHVAAGAAMRLGHILQWIGLVDIDLHHDRLNDVEKPRAGLLAREASASTVT